MFKAGMEFSLVMSDGKVRMSYDYPKTTEDV